MIDAGAGADFNATTRTDAIFAQTTMTNANLTGADLASDSFATTSFDDATLTDAEFGGDTIAATVTTTGATWSNTTCPDFTNSNSDGGTCVGHGF